MNEKYYISDQTFFGDITNDNKVWDYFISYLKNIDDKIITTQWLPMNEFEIDNNLLYWTDFRNEKPNKIFISQKPFLINISDMYLCREYKLNENIYSIIEKDWLKELQEEFVCPTFIIKHHEQTQFMLTYENIIARFVPKVLRMFNDLGFEFKEWNIKLNDVL